MQSWGDKIDKQIFDAIAALRKAMNTTGQEQAAWLQTAKMRVRDASDLNDECHKRT